MEVSYLWDKIINKFSNDLRQGKIQSSETIIHLKLALKYLNQESRTDRRYYSEQFSEIITKGLRSRCIIPPNQQLYKYLLMPITDKNVGRKELQLQTLCEIARFQGLETSIVIGISYRFLPNGGFSFDLAYSEVNDITKSLRQRVSKIRKTLGYFKE